MNELKADKEDYKLTQEIINNGSSEAFNKLYFKYNNSVYKVAASRLNSYKSTANEADREEVVQNTWLHVWENLSEFNPYRYKFVQYVIGLAKRYSLRLVTNRKYGNERKKEELRSEFETVDSNNIFELYAEVFDDADIALSESDNNSVWNIATKAIFSRVKRPQQVIAFNFNKVIFPAKYSKNKKEVRQRGFPKLVVTEKAYKKILILAYDIYKEYMLYLGRNIKNEHMQAFKNIIFEQAVEEKKLEDFFSNNPEKNITDWSSRFQKKIANIMTKEFYNIFKEEIEYYTMRKKGSNHD